MQAFLKGIYRALEGQTKTQDEVYRGILYLAKEGVL